MAQVEWRDLEQLESALPDLCLVAAGIKAKAWIPRLIARIRELEMELLASRAAHRSAWGLFEAEVSARKILEEELRAKTSA